MKIKEYKFINQSNPIELEFLIKKELNSGWQPFGGVSNTYEYKNHTMWFSQAMVKYEEENSSLTTSVLCSNSKESKLYDFIIEYFPSIEKLEKRSDDLIK